MTNIISPAAFNHTMEVTEELNSSELLPADVTKTVVDTVIDCLEDGVKNGYDTYLVKFP